MAHNTNYKRVSNNSSEGTNYKKVMNNSDSTGASSSSSSSSSSGQSHKRADVVRLMSDVRAGGGGEKRAAAIKQLKEWSQVKEVKKTLIEENFTPNLIQLLKEKSLELKKDVALILVSLTCNEQEAHRQVHECGGVAVLMREITQHTDQDYVEHCQIALGNTADNQEANAQIVQLGGVRMGLRLLREEKNSWRVRARAAKLFGNTAVCEEVGENDGVKLLVKLVQQDDNDCVKWGAYALYNLLWHVPAARREAANTPGLVERLMEAMRREDYECLTRCRCAVVILRMCEESGGVVEQCRDSFLAPDLLILQAEITDDMYGAQWFRYQLNNLMEKLRL